MQIQNIRTFTVAEWAFLFSYDHKFLVSNRLGLDPEMDGVPVAALAEDYDWLFAPAEYYLNTWGNQEINQREPNNPLGCNHKRNFGGNDDVRTH